jgi:WD40 repeat protein
LASGSDDCTVRLWNLSTFREVLAWKTDKAGFLSFSPSDEILAAGTSAQKIHFWRAPSWQEIAAKQKADPN